MFGFGQTEVVEDLDKAFLDEKFTQPAGRKGRWQEADGGAADGAVESGGFAFGEKCFDRSRVVEPGGGPEDVVEDAFDAFGAEEGDGLGAGCGAPAEVMGPEGVGEAGEEGFGLAEVGLVEGVEEFGPEGNESGEGGEASLGAVNGSDGLARPAFFGEDFVGPLGAFFPPTIPELAEPALSGGVGEVEDAIGEEAGEAVEAGFAVGGWESEKLGDGEAAGKAEEGLAVFGVAHGFSEAEPEGLIVAEKGDAGLEGAGFGSEAEPAGVAEEVADLVVGEGGDGLAASAEADAGGEFFGRGGEEGAEAGEGEAELGGEFDLADGSPGVGGGEEGAGPELPDDVEDDVVVGAVAVVAVVGPVGSGGVDFDGADLFFAATVEEAGGGEVGAAAFVPETGLEDVNGFAGCCLQGITVAFLEPKSLYVGLG